jgi:hypothetical protein
MPNGDKAVIMFESADGQKAAGFRDESRSCAGAIPVSLAPTADDRQGGPRRAFPPGSALAVKALQNPAMLR